MEYAITVVAAGMAMGGMNELYRRGVVSLRTARVSYVVGATLVLYCFATGVQY